MKYKIKDIKMMNNSTNSFGVKTIEFETALKESYGRTGKMNDIINHPSHYCEGRKYEPIDVILDWDLNFTLGNTIKYISRAGRKDDIIQDLEKAEYYLKKEIDRLKKIRQDKYEEDEQNMIKVKYD